MRQIIPFVGQATDTVALVIGVVLMALAWGYYAGGRYKTSERFSVRQKLCLNFLVAMLFLIPALSYASLNYIFKGMFTWGLHDRLIMTALYAGMFLFTPVFMLGQTIPLISRFLKVGNMSRLTGVVLFFSTCGSFVGAVLTPVFLMNVLGVNYTAVVVFAVLACMILALSKPRWKGLISISLGLFVLGWGMNTHAVMVYFNIIKTDTYHNVALIKQGDSRYFSLNNNLSSQYSDDGKKHDYIAFFEDQTINTFQSDDEPRDILVIGAGGFTFGHEDTHNRYDFVDINKNLKDLAEEHLLQEKIPDNQVFHAMPIRMFLNQNAKTYDVIFIDVYYGFLSMPEHLLTREFFAQVKEHLKPGGVLGMNMMASPHLSDPFSRGLDDTIRAVFPYVIRHPMSRYYRFNRPRAMDNVMYMYKHSAYDGTPVIFTDNINRSFLGK